MAKPKSLVKDKNMDMMEKLVKVKMRKKKTGKVERERTDDEREDC